MSGYALAIGRVPAMGALPRWRWGRAVVLAVVALLAVAGQALVWSGWCRPIASPPSATAEATPPQGTWPAGLREATAPRSPPAPITSPPTPTGHGGPPPRPRGCAAGLGPRVRRSVPSAGAGTSPVAGPHRAPRRPGPGGGGGGGGLGRGRGVPPGPGLTEWYRNEARGLEQGFTLATAPAGGPAPSSSSSTPRGWPWP